MWKCLKISGKNYAFSSRKDNNVTKVFLTDFVSLWSEELTIKTIIERCKKLNPLLKIEAINIEEIIEEILSQIPEMPECETVIELNNYKIILYKNIKGGKFKFELNLSRGSNEEFFGTIMKHICSMTIDLMQKYSLLLKVVKDKDEEIAEYKAVGARLIRKNIETKPFTEDSLNFQQVTTEECCESKFKSLVNLCNKAEELNSRCHEKLKSNISEETQVVAKETDIVHEEEKIEAKKTNEVHEEVTIKSEKINDVAKRKIGGISASFTKPVKKTKSRVTNFIS